MRTGFVTKLLIKWQKDLEIILSKLSNEDKIHFTETLLKFTELHKRVTEDYAPIAKLYDEEILKKYGSKIRIAFDINFWVYYDQLPVLASKDIIASEEFNNSEIQGFSEKEWIDYLNAMIRSLQNTKTHLYIYQPQEQDNDNLEGLSENRVKFTTSKQALAIHYIFEALEVNDVSYPAKARFIELLTGKSFENILKWVKGTKGKTPKNRNEDLEFIKPYFEELKLTQIVDSINNDIDPFEKEMKKIKK